MEELKRLTQELIDLCLLRGEPNEMYSSDQMDKMILDKQEEMRELIEYQRQIGANEFGEKMRKRYSKTADKFYTQFADRIYYKDKDGQECGLDIQTLWYFRTNEMITEENNSQNK